LHATSCNLHAAHPPAGFTRIAALMSPDEAMHLLDRLFQRFDSLAIAHGAYKVEARENGRSSRGLAHLCCAAVLRCAACALTDALLARTPTLDDR
jgi:hypothetical protein